VDFGNWGPQSPLGLTTTFLTSYWATFIFNVFEFEFFIKSYVSM